jgi:hypothetical protein
LINQAQKKYIVYGLFFSLEGFFGILFMCFSELRFSLDGAIVLCVVGAMACFLYAYYGEVEPKSLKEASKRKISAELIILITIEIFALALDIGNLLLNVYLASFLWPLIILAIYRLFEKKL